MTTLPTTSIDWRDLPTGGFAGPVARDARIGTFADGALVRAQGAGTFAGSAAAQRVGSFADTRRAVPAAGLRAVPAARRDEQAQARQELAAAA
jgi:hypothetical protein